MKKLFFTISILLSIHYRVTNGATDPMLIKYDFFPLFSKENNIRDKNNYLEVLGPSYINKYKLLDENTKRVEYIFKNQTKIQKIKKDIYKDYLKHAQGVLGVSSINNDKDIAASAWYIGDQFVITANHVANKIPCSKQIFHHSYYHEQYRCNQIIHCSKILDYCLIKLNPKKELNLLRPFKIKNMKKLKTQKSYFHSIAKECLDFENSVRNNRYKKTHQINGDYFSIIGYPSIKEFNKTNSLGPHVSAGIGNLSIIKDHNNKNSNLILHSIPSRGGNSGSPIINENGELIGMHIASDKLCIGTKNFQITIEYVNGIKNYAVFINDILKDLKKNKINLNLSSSSPINNYLLDEEHEIYFLNLIK